MILIESPLIYIKYMNEEGFKVPARPILVLTCFISIVSSCKQVTLAILFEVKFCSSEISFEWSLTSSPSSNCRYSNKTSTFENYWLYYTGQTRSNGSSKLGNCVTDIRYFASHVQCLNQSEWKLKRFDFRAAHFKLLKLFLDV